MQPKLKRFTSVVLLVVAAAVLAAPMAEAGRGNGKGHRKWKRGHEVTRVVHEHRYYPRSRRVVVHRDGGAAPLIAGFIGGLIVGSHVGTAHAAPARVVHVYHDPYCDTRFSSLAVYEDHLYRHRHPRVVRVIERDSGHCVSTRHWHDRRWIDSDECSCHGSRYKDRYGYDDRYGHDDGYDDGYYDDRW